MVLGKYGPTVLVSDGYAEEYVLYQNLARGISTRSLKYPKTGIRNYSKLRGRWEQIMYRCYDERCDVYDCYGGRGITVSEEFKDCRVFCEYISALPNFSKASYQLDRENNSKGYERGNLRWVTPRVNNGNKRTNVMVEWNGEMMCLQHFIKDYTKISASYARRLYEEGMSLEAMTEYIPHRRRNN